MTGEREMLGARVPSSVKRLVDVDPRDNQEVVEAALWKEFGGERRSLLETKIGHKTDRIEQLDREIADLQREKQRLEEERESLRARLEDVEAATEEYDAALDGLLDGLEAGDPPRVFPEHGEVQRLAEEHGSSPTDIMHDLKQRAARQNRELTVDRFKDGREVGAEDIKTLIGEAINGGDSA